MNCPNCGNKLDENTGVCPNCQNNASLNNWQNDPKLKKLILGVMLFILFNIKAFSISIIFTLVVDAYLILLYFAKKTPRGNTNILKIIRLILSAIIAIYLIVYLIRMIIAIVNLISN